MCFLSLDNFLIGKLVFSESILWLEFPVEEHVMRAQFSQHTHTCELEYIVVQEND